MGFFGGTDGSPGSFGWGRDASMRSGGGGTMSAGIGEMYDEHRLD